MGAVQYFDNAQASVAALAGTDADAKKKWVDGYGVTVGAVTPVAGGTLKTQFGYMSAEGSAVGATDEYDAWNVGALYYYNLSKRTSVYGGLGYTVQGEKGADDYKTVNGAVGLIHKF
jgi:predicted porin